MTSLTTSGTGGPCEGPAYLLYLPSPLSAIKDEEVRLSPVGNKDPLICSRTVPLKCHSLRQLVPSSFPPPKCPQAVL